MTSRKRSILAGFDVDKPSSSSSTLRFTRKHVLSLQNNPICGITLPAWLSILSRHFFFISWATYLPRVLFISLLAVFNSVLAAIEFVLYERRIRATKLPDDPIFIIGHPRTGTTLLHNLLSIDTQNFYTPTTFTVGFPSSFLFFEPVGKSLFSGVLSETRPMDRMPLQFDLPQEDELATNVLSGGHSYYMPLFFMQRETAFRKFIDFELGGESSGASDAGFCRWRDSFLYFLRKVTLRHHLAHPEGSSARLLLKSPIHTGRVALLRRLFPRATFVYLHRDPYQVMQSAAHMADTTYWYSYLDSPSDEQISEFILWQFQELFRLYDRDALAHAPAAPAPAPAPVSGESKASSAVSAAAATKDERRKVLAPDVLECAYREDLIAAPLDTLAQVYEKAGLAFGDRQRALFRDAVSEIGQYQPNEHACLPEGTTRTVDARWRPYFHAFGYEMRE